MKSYPSINVGPIRDVDVVAFDKLDGSNIRAEWSRKKGVFYKFGSRHRLIDGRDPVLGRAPDLVRNKYEKQLNAVFKSMGYESVVCFFEFFGPSSFAGWHDVNESHDVVLFDIAPFKRGLISPSEFLSLTQGLCIPKVLHRGPVDDEFIDQVRSGTLPGMTFEGVVCKTSTLKMFKIKNRAWLSRLKEKCGDNQKLYERLA